MEAYFVKYYEDEYVLVKLKAPGKLNSGEAEAFIYKEGVWRESPNHVLRVLYEGEYDEVSEAEAVELMKKRT